jgi:hypothetical protein
MPPDHASRLVDAPPLAPLRDDIVRYAVELGVSGARHMELAARHLVA